MAERHFTYADIEKFFNERSEKLNASSDLKVERQIVCISILPELSPPTWIVQYSATYHKGTESEWTDHALLLITEKRDYKGDPWLNGPMRHDLPAGFASPAEEDAEIERRCKASIKALLAEEQRQRELAELRADMEGMRERDAKQASDEE
jgi:hypothetical protein